jgi:hypothetical protein
MIVGINNDIFRLRNSLPSLHLPMRAAYPSKIPINKSKMDDIAKTMPYIPDTKIEFWTEILTANQQPW